MKVEIKQNVVVLTREPGDPKYHGIRGAQGEHGLFYALKVWLNANGHDFVKKRAWTDGHLMGDKYQPILRTRSPRSKGLNGIIYSGFYAMRGANEDWNTEGRVVLNLERGAFKEQT